MQDPFQIGGVRVVPGTRQTIDLPVMNLSNHAPMAISAEVVHGRKPGPRLFVCAALHGDEINGVEIIRRLLQLSALKRLRGTLIAVPIVNVFGFVANTRYLPDRRDLNRAFPGSPRGSLTSRLANVFVTEVLDHSTHGVDLHTGATHRTNFPQIRADLDDAETERLAMAFNAPLVINAGLRAGSLRETASREGIPVLVYEAGEALRFDEASIRIGVRGMVNLMRTLEMLPKVKKRDGKPRTLVIRSSSWVRAPASGVVRATTELGSVVRKGQVLGVLSDPFGINEVNVEATGDGVIVGRATIPVVNEGDALFHIGHTTGTKVAADTLDAHFNDGEYERGITSELAEEPPIV